MLNHLRLLWPPVLLALALGLGACSANTVTMATDGPSSLSLVAWDRLTEEGEVIGPSPQTIPVEKLQGKILKISAPDKESQYWVFTEAQGSKLEAKATLIAKAVVPKDKDKEPEKKTAKDKGKDPESAAAIRKMNSGNRILMNSYEALTSERYDLARQLAQQLSQLNPTVAAAQIIIGLSYLKEGNTQQAVASFRKARSLDPEDREVEQLLQMVQ